MDPTPRRFPSSSDRLLAAINFSPSSTTAVTNSADDEFNESELFWSSDSSESENQPPPPQPTELTRHRSFDLAQDSGILAALSGPDHSDSTVFRGKSPISSSRMIPSFPRPRPSSEQIAQSLPSRRFQHSAPVKVPIMPPNRFLRRRNLDELAALDDDDIDADEEMLPPHEFVARGSGVSQRTSFSVLEGAGRTLKGRDLCQVRNAVLRQTGFLD